MNFKRYAAGGILALGALAIGLTATAMTYAHGTTPTPTRQASPTSQVASSENDSTAVEALDQRAGHDVELQQGSETKDATSTVAEAPETHADRDALQVQKGSQAKDATSTAAED